MATILDFKMQIILSRKLVIDFLKFENVTLGVQIFILSYSEAVLHEKLEYTAAILNFKMVDTTSRQ